MFSEAKPLYRRVLTSWLTQLSDAMSESSYAMLWQRHAVFRGLFHNSEAYLLERLSTSSQLSTPTYLVHRPLYFLHIPKTAGSSLKYWLADLFATGEVLELYTLSNLEDALPDKIQHCQHYTGHLGFALHDFLPEGFEIDVFTWLRHPAKRDISQYRYIRETREGQLSMFLSPELMHYVEAAASLSLADLCRSEAYQGIYDNLQTRMLSGLVPPQANGRSLTQAEIAPDEGWSDDPDRDLSQPVDGRQPQGLTAALANLRRCQRQALSGADLDAARATLLALPHFGLCEWMQPSVDLFCYRFALLPKLFDYRLNQSQQRSQALGEDDRALVDQNNALDFALYEFARHEFQARILALWQDCLAQTSVVERYLGGSSLWHDHRDRLQEGDVDLLLDNWEGPEMRSLIEHVLMENFQRRRQADPRYRRFLFSFSRAMFWSGWHPRYYDDELNTWLRWAGPTTEAMVLLPLQAGPAYRVIFQVLRWASLDLLESLRLYVADEEIPLQRLAPSATGEAWLLTGFIPAGAIAASRPYTPLTFKTDEVAPLKLASNGATSSGYASFALSSLLAEGIG